MAEAITSLEQRGHPFPGAQFSRVDWAKGLNIPVMAELDNPATVDTLLWVGCAGALLERNHSVVRSLALLLQQAGVSFAILGREERCTGDPARRMGNEFLFKTMAEKNIALLGKYGVEKILTPCPHCFNTFRNDYPGLGGRYEVEHHSTFLARLVGEGRLRLSSRIERKLTFHDPCYLGRYNGVFEEPRTLIRTSTGAPVAEMARNRQAGFCCGGGGGLSFADEPPAQRVNQVRARQAVATGADIVGVACPFCMTMLEDGIKASEGDRAVEVKDVAELLWQSVGCGKETLWI